jgi:hypothetical protein
MERADPVTRNKSIWLLELDNSVFTRLTFNRADLGYRTRGGIPSANGSRKAVGGGIRKSSTTGMRQDSVSLTQRYRALARSFRVVAILLCFAGIVGEPPKPRKTCNLIVAFCPTAVLT